jgi:AcrR family transcriptional regulator
MRAAAEMDVVTTTKEKSSGSRQRWKQDPEAVRSDILRVATEEFATNGLSGARIDDIAAKTRTSKRMIYYYFGDKDGLYRQVLEEAYRKVRAQEQELDVEQLDSVEALKRLVEFTFEHHSRNPDFIRLVMIENIHHGAYLDQSEVIATLNRTAIDILESIYCKGRREGVFRSGLKPLDLHWQISAMSFFKVSNRATFTRIFGDALATPAGQSRLRKLVVATILRYALTPSAAAELDRQ